MIDRARVPSSRRLLAVLAVVLVIGTAACGGDGDQDDAADSPDASTATTARPEEADTTAAWDEVVAAAEDEGSVTVFLPGTPAVSEALAAAFEDAYGIRATIIGGAATELQPRFDEERRARRGEVDVFFSASSAYMDPIIEAGDFAKLVGPELKSESFVDYPELRVDETAVVGVANPPYIVWNTDLVDDPIAGYEDLLGRADELEGRIAAPDLYADLIVAFYSDIEAGLERDDVVESLLATEPRLFTGANPLVQSVASGETAVGIGAYSTVYAAVVASGAPIDGVVDESAPNTVNLVGGVTDWAANPNAGQVFIDFVLSEAGQEIIAAGSVSIRDGIEGTIGGPELIKLDDPSYRDPAYLEEFRTRWDAARG